MKKIVALTFYLTINYANGLYAQAGSTLTDEKQDGKALTLVAYNQTISKTDKLVLVYFSANWCTVCLKMKPLIAKTELKFFQKIEVLRIDTDKDKEVAKEFEIDALPVLLLYKNGIMQWIYIGLIDEKLLSATLESY